MAISPKNAGRAVAIIMIAQMPVAPVVNFVLIGPVTKSPGFLVNALSHATEMRLAALLWFVSAAFMIGIAAVVAPLFRRYSEPMAIWLVATSIAGCLTLIGEGTVFLTMLSVSQQNAQAGGADMAYQAVGRFVGSARGWVHYANLLIGCATALVLHAGLFRFSLVPRWLAGFGTLAAALGVVGILMPIAGYQVVLQLLVPLGLAQMALLLWLLVKGFGDSSTPPLGGPARND